MTNRHEPDDVDLFVEGVGLDDRASQEVSKFIEEYKNRPEYRREAEEAERILGSLGINAKDHEIQDPRSLLEHWRRCVEDLHEIDRKKMKVETE